MPICLLLLLILIVHNWAVAYLSAVADRYAI
jgi:hypothetical protein